jgi:hypothetical protein
LDQQWNQTLAYSAKANEEEAGSGGFQGGNGLQQERLVTLERFAVCQFEAALMKIFLN